MSAQAPPDATPPPLGSRPLVRRRDDRVVAGVCSGVARYLGVDPAIVRIATIVLVFAGGTGIVGYVLGWALLPQEGSDLSVAEGMLRDPKRTPSIMGLVLVTIGALILLDRFFWWDEAVAWPFLLLLAGGYLLWRSAANRSGPDLSGFGDAAGSSSVSGSGSSSGGTASPAGRVTAGPGHVAPASSTATPFGPCEPSTVTSQPTPTATFTRSWLDKPASAGSDPTEEAPPSADDPTEIMGDEPAATTTDTTASTEPVPTDRGFPTGPAFSATGGSGDAAPPPAAPPGSAPTAPFARGGTAETAPSRPVADGVTRPPSGLGGAVMGLLFVGAGAVGIAAAAGATISLPAVFAGGLFVVGGGLMVGARYGRARWLILPGLVLVVGLAVTAAIDVPLEGGIGDRYRSPQSIADLDAAYRLGAGELTVDLRQIDFPAGSTVEVEATVGIGHLVVIVPHDATVEVDGQAEIGAVDVLGRHEDGTEAEVDVLDGGTELGGRIEVEARVGIGQVEVFRAAP